MKELVKGLIEKRTPEGICVLNCHYSVDPDRAKPEWKKQERRKYTSESKWQSEQEMVFSAGGGERLFAEILNKYGHKIIIDPETSGFKPSPHWTYFGGFDSGKKNPTAALIACIDEDGTIYILREYYIRGLSPKEHVPLLKQFIGFESTPMYADPSMFHATHAQNDGKIKAIASLYAEEGIVNLGPAPENNELMGIERILSYWANLDECEPKLKIVCPKALQDIAKPVYGIRNDGCPNLLWELRRTRRAELTPTQLATHNPTEMIVDKDNHLRDSLKYAVLACPDPAVKSWQQEAAEQIAPMAANGDLTSCLIRYQRCQEEAEDCDRDRPMVYLGRRSSRRRY